MAPFPALLSAAPAGASAAVLASYLVGSIPFGLLLGRVVGKVDIRRLGSGNIGATNVGRVLGRRFALLAFMADFLKGAVPVALIAPLAAGRGEHWPLSVVCGIAAVCGHVWPVWLRFRGGKGVATGCGAMAGVDPLVFLGGGAVWLLTLFTTRFVGLSSIAMGTSFPLFAWLRSRHAPYGLEVALGAGALTVLVLWRHRGNVARMLEGNEPRVGRPRQEEAP